MAGCVENREQYRLWEVITVGTTHRVADTVSCSLHDQGHNQAVDSQDLGKDEDEDHANK